MVVPYAAGGTIGNATTKNFQRHGEDAVETGVDKVETALVKRAIKNSDTAAIAYLKSAGALRTQGVR